MQPLRTGGCVRRDTKDVAAESLAIEAPIGIAGAGRIAQALGRLLIERGESVAGVASRDLAHARDAAGFMGERVQPVAYSQLPRHARRILIAVPDDAVTEVARTLAEAGMKGGAALHTAGSRGPDALRPLAANGVSCATLHPLQTVPTREHGLAALQGIAFGITGDGPAALWAESIARLLDGEPLRIAAEARPLYHAAAVMASNYMVALVDAAVMLMSAAGIEPGRALRAIAPLVRASSENALALGPLKALTGPIERGDVETVARHLTALARVEPSLRDLYRAAGAQLLPLACGRGLAGEKARKLEELLIEKDR